MTKIICVLPGPDISLVCLLGFLFKYAHFHQNFLKKKCQLQPVMRTNIQKEKFRPLQLNFLTGYKPWNKGYSRGNGRHLKVHVQLLGDTHTCTGSIK